VVGDRDLLGCVLGFVGGATGRERVRALGQVSLVSRLWREESYREGLWVGVEEEVVPALWREEQGGRVAVGRGRLVQYGRQLFAERRMWSEVTWTAGLELHVEVFDRMDGLQMLSARGPLVYSFLEDGERTRLTLPVLPPVEVRGAAFSAASRDPEQRRFADIEAYFDEGHRSEYPCSLCVRVTVRDQRTGKYGVLWEDGKETPRGSSRNHLGTFVSSQVKAMVGGRGDGLQCWTRFVICPEPNQEGVAEEDRLHRIARGGSIPEDEYHFRLIVGSVEIAQVGSMIRSLC
jgi:hypothetical protein